MPDDITRCKSCGTAMMYIENKRKNDFYIMKVDTWHCQRCGKTVEEPRLDKNYGWK